MEELTLEEIQQESFKVLLKLKEIFDQKGWKFYLTYGTLIGAVRHKGFIPWDDDIDVWVPRKDYNEFIEYYIKNKEEFDYFQVLHAKTNKKYPYGIARFSNSNYKIDYFEAKDYGLGLFVDLYPLDEIDITDIKYKNHQLKRLKFASRFDVISKSLLKSFVKMLIKPLFLIGNLKLRMYKYRIYTDKKAQQFNNTNQKYLSVNAWIEIENAPLLKEDIFGEERFLEFNGVMMPVPTNYDKLLRQEYGDYMQLPPEEERIGHHFYKAYKK